MLRGVCSILAFFTRRTKIEKEKKEHAKLHGMIRTEISGAEIAEEMEKERRFFQLQMCEVRWAVRGSPAVSPERPVSTWPDFRPRPQNPTCTVGLPLSGFCYRVGPVHLTPAFHGRGGKRESRERPFRLHVHTPSTRLLSPGLS